MFDTKNDELSRLKGIAKAAYNSYGMSSFVKNECAELAYRAIVALLVFIVSIVFMSAVGILIIMVIVGSLKPDHIDAAMTIGSLENWIFIFAILAAVITGHIVFKLGNNLALIASAVTDLYEYDKCFWKSVLPWKPEYVVPEHYIPCVFSKDTLGTIAKRLALRSSLTLYLILYVFYSALYYFPEDAQAIAKLSLPACISVWAIILCLWSVMVAWLIESSRYTYKYYVEFTLYNLAKPNEWKNWPVIKWFMATKETKLTK